MNLTRQAILTHQQSAPWAQLIQVEQDLLLSLAMVAVFHDGFLRSQVAMRGGTALHKVHLAPAARYSEDIDLVLVGNRPPGHIDKALARVLNDVLGKPARHLLEEVKLTIRNLAMPSVIRRLEYIVPSVCSPGKSIKIKVEVNVSEKQPWAALEKVGFSIRAFGEVEEAQLVTYALDEMLGTKLRALFQRRQGRDLFDLYWAFAGEVNPVAGAAHPKRTVAAFQHYMEQEGTKADREDLVNQLQLRLADKGFCSDMDPLLRSDIQYDPKIAGPLIEDVLL